MEMESELTSSAAAARTLAAAAVFCVGSVLSLEASMKIIKQCSQ